METALAARIEAFLQEFPFLKRYVKPNDITHRPLVQRIDLDLINRRSKPRGLCSGDPPYVRFLIIGTDGCELTEVRPDELKKREVKFSLFHPDTWFDVFDEIKGETVGEALRRLDDPYRVACVVEIRDIFFGPEIRSHYPDWGGIRVILHKVPSGRLFADWLVHLQDVAQEELRGELTKIDKA
jgi:hypothetical protein